MGKGCRCNGWTERDISPWCEIHATVENLFEHERQDAVDELKESLAFIHKRLAALDVDQQSEQR